MKATKAEKAESLQTLRASCPVGETIWACYRGTTRNGTSYIDFYVLKGSADGSVSKHWLSYHMARALGLRFDERRDCILAPFMNMDQAFEIVARLARTLHGDYKSLRKENF